MWPGQTRLVLIFLHKRGLSLEEHRDHTPSPRLSQHPLPAGGPSQPGPLQQPTCWRTFATGPFATASKWLAVCILRAGRTLTRARWTVRRGRAPLKETRGGAVPRLFETIGAFVSQSGERSSRPVGPPTFFFLRFHQGQRFNDGQPDGNKVFCLSPKCMDNYHKHRHLSSTSLSVWTIIVSTSSSFHESAYPSEERVRAFVEGRGS